MSPKEQKITSGREAMAWARSIISSDVTHTGTTGAMHQLDPLGQELIDAVLDDGMRLPAADFHDDPGPGHGARNGVGQFARGRGVAIFVEVFHGDGTSQFVELVHLIEKLEDALGLRFIDA